MRTDVTQYFNPTSKEKNGVEYLDSRDTKIQEKIRVKRRLQEFVKIAIQNNSANPIPDNLMMVHNQNRTVGLKDPLARNENQYYYINQKNADEAKNRPGPEGTGKDTVPPWVGDGQPTAKNEKKFVMNGTQWLYRSSKISIHD